MNRTTALFLALALLLAHALAIHHTMEGEFASIYERAHVAFRISRNIVYEGHLAWSRDMQPAESYPSPLWIALNCIPLRLYTSPVHFVQGLGLLAALLCIPTVAGFSPRRLAGIIAPLLLVVNGALAASATDGTETTLVALLLTASYLALVRGRALALALCGSLLCMARPEGVLMVALLALFELVRGRELRRPVLLALGAAFATEAALALARNELYGTPLSPGLHDILRYDPDQLALGLRYVWSSTLLLGSPFLVVVAAVCLVFKHLSPMGSGALILGLAWAAIVTWTGGDERACGAALAPAYPLLFVAAQEAMTRLMDSRVRLWEPTCWLLFVSALGTSAMGSKAPGDIGPFHVGEQLLERAQPDELQALAWDRSLGRQGIQEELEATQRLRRISIFLRDRLVPNATILSPWPGAIGYLTRKRVRDMRGRLAPPPDAEQPNSWSGARRTDVIKLLQEGHDYIVPGVQVPARPPLLRELAQEWMRRYDVHGARPERAQEYLSVLVERYELIAVPLPDEETRHASSSMPFYLLRRIDLDLGPSLELELEDDVVRVLMRHRGHRQLADLELRVTLADGSVSWVRPTGQLSASTPSHALTGILLSKAESPPIDLYQWPLPVGVEVREVSAVLRNPRSQHDEEYSTISEKVRIEI